MWPESTMDYFCKVQPKSIHLFCCPDQGLSVKLVLSQALDYTTGNHMFTSLCISVFQHAQVHAQVHASYYNLQFVCTFTMLSQTLAPAMLKFQGVMGVTVGCFMASLVKTRVKLHHRAEKKAKNGILARKSHGTTGLKLDMHKQLDSWSNMGWVPLCHTSSSWCVRLKNAKKNISIKHLDQGS